MKLQTKLKKYKSKNLSVAINHKYLLSVYKLDEFLNLPSHLHQLDVIHSSVDLRTKDNEKGTILIKDYRIVVLELDDDQYISYQSQINTYSQIKDIFDIVDIKYDEYINDVYHLVKNENYSFEQLENFVYLYIFENLEDKFQKHLVSCLFWMALRKNNMKSNIVTLKSDIDIIYKSIITRKPIECNVLELVSELLKKCYKKGNRKLL